MRKLIVFFLALAMVLSLSMAFAGDIYPKPILFCGIEWGSTYDEAVQKMPEGVKLSSLETSNYFYSTEDVMSFQTRNYKYVGECGGSAYATDSDLGGLKVAGYPVKGIGIEFAYIPGDDGLLIRDSEHSALTGAIYQFDVLYPDAAFNDLVAKLTSLYGDVDIDNHDDGISAKTDLKLWYGEDGTMVSVVLQDYGSTSNKDLVVIYSYAGREELLEVAYNACVYEESVNAGSSTDGL